MADAAPAELDKPPAAAGRFGAAHRVWRGLRRLDHEPKLFFIDPMLVGFAEVGFAHCRISGLIYFVAITLSSPWLGVMSLICNFSATLTAFLFQFERGFIENGFASYSACLIGTNLAFNWKPEWSWQPIVCCIIAGSLSAFLSVAMCEITNKKTWTYPYNIISQVIFWYMKPAGAPSAPIPWSEFKAFDLFDGVVCGVGEIIYALDWQSGLITMAGSLWFSKELFGAQVFGSAVGFFCAWAVDADLLLARLGLWGFNPALICSCIVLFFEPTWRLLPLMLWCAIGTTALNAALVTVFGGVFHSPVNTLPWCLSGTIVMTLQNGMIRGLAPKRKRDEESSPTEDEGQRVKV